MPHALEAKYPKKGSELNKKPRVAGFFIEARSITFLLVNTKLSKAFSPRGTTGIVRRGIFSRVRRFFCGVRFLRRFHS